MRIHHLNAISSCPLFARGHLVCHCLLIETSRGLVLVDTGLGLRDVADPHGRLSRVMLRMLRPDLRAEMTAIRQVERLGFDPRDVRHIVLTHLDFDHAGGLDDFPGATVHLLAMEMRDALAQVTLLDRMRYRPAQWSTRPSWQAHLAEHGERWFGFDCVRDLGGMDSEILLVPLAGHTIGHAGVAVRGDRGWLLMAGDAYFHVDEMRPDTPHCPPGLRFYQRLMEKHRPSRLHNQERLRELARTGAVTVVCSHDLVEFERLAGHPAVAPAASRPALTSVPVGV